MLMAQFFLKLKKTCHFARRFVRHAAPLQSQGKLLQNIQDLSHGKKRYRSQYAFMQWVVEDLHYSNTKYTSAILPAFTL
jgi:hypothetical protein